MVIMLSIPPAITKKPTGARQWETYYMPHAGVRKTKLFLFNHSSANPSIQPTFLCMKLPVLAASILPLGSCSAH